jgi:Ca-activated chloride channel family protein
VELGGVWIDDGFNPKMEAVNIKAASKAYFRMLERHPSIREVFQLGNYVVWVTPSGKALIIDQNAGQEELADTVIDQLFVPAPPAAKDEKKK